MTLTLTKPVEEGVAIVGVQRDQLMDVWPLVTWHFQSFADRSKGETTPGKLLYEVAEGKRQCWLALEGKAVKACALTEVVESTKTVVLNFCAGEDRADWWEAIVGEIERWGREQLGSKKLIIVCRPGWVRDLKKLGFRETHRVVERSLVDG